MKAFAVIVVVLVLALSSVMGYALFNTSLVVEGKGMQVLSAQSRPEDFHDLQQSMEHENQEGMVYTDQVPMDASMYNFYVYTLRLKNRCLVPAEMVEVQVVGKDGDVLSYDDENQVNIAPGASRDVWCVLLTQGTPTAVREIVITYYLWGNPQTVRYTYE